MKTARRSSDHHGLNNNSSRRHRRRESKMKMLLDNPLKESAIVHSSVPERMSCHNRIPRKSIMKKKPPPTRRPPPKKKIPATKDSMRYLRISQETSRTKDKNGVEKVEYVEHLIESHDGTLDSSRKYRQVYVAQDLTKVRFPHQVPATVWYLVSIMMVKQPVWYY